MNKESINLYHRWLAIPPEECPANHYRLLGVPLFESDAEVISSAADKQMGHLKTFQNGRHPIECQKMLNEVAAARVCLLNPQSKAAYDATLRGNEETEIFVSKAKAKTKRATPPHFFTAMAVTLAVVVCLVLYLFTRPNSEVVEVPKPEAPKVVKVLKPDPPKVVEIPKPVEPPKVVEAPKPVEPKVVEAPKPVEPKVVEAPKPVEPKVDPKPEPKPAPQVITEQDKRHPLPTDDEQQNGLAAAKEVYGNAFKAAKTTDQKRVLAEKVIKKASESKDDPIGQYVLLRLARDIAVSGGELDLAMNAAEQIGSKYRVDPYQTKLEAMLLASKHVSTLKQRTSLAGHAFRLVPEAVACDDFDNAKRLCGMARQIRDRELVQRATACSKELNQIAAAFAEAQPSIAKLKETPTDPQANSVAGRYQCFVKGNWAQGLPMLAQGNDEKVKLLASKELEGTMGKEVALADQWWMASETMDGRERDVVQLHATDLYRKALSQLTGLEKSRIEKRLAEMKTSIVLTAEGEAKSETLVSSLPLGAISVLTFEQSTFATQGNRVFVKDLSGKGNHGEVFGAKMVEGKAGKALNLDGKSYVVVSGAFPIANSPRTIGLWLRLADPTKYEGKSLFIFAYGDLQRKCGMFSAYINGSIWYAATGVRCGGFGTGWHHQVNVYDGKELRAYLDGTKVLTADKPYNGVGQHDTGPGPLVIGGRMSGKSIEFLCPGDIDEFAIFDRALTDEEVKQVYELGVNGQNLVKRSR